MIYTNIFILVSHILYRLIRLSTFSNPFIHSIVASAPTAFKSYRMKYHFSFIVTIITRNHNMNTFVILYRCNNIVIFIYHPLTHLTH